MSYLRVCESIGSIPVELPSEDDDTLPVSTLQAQFPNAIGLKYLPDENSEIYRGIRCIGNKLKPPREGWDGLTLYCVYAPDYKRKFESAPVEVAKKPRTAREVKCSDLIVLGLNFSTTNDSLKEYFEEKFGPLLMALVKVDMNSKRSKGFGFVRFVKYEDQVKALSARKHEIDGRWVTIKPPFAKEGAEPALPSKVFISRLSPTMTREDIEDYFIKYGEIGDTFLPKPFRGFAFLTFVSPEAADHACEEEPHIINGVSVSVVHASEQQKKDKIRGHGRGRGGRGYSAKYYPSSQSRYYDAPPSAYSYSSVSSRGGYSNSYSSRDNDYNPRDDYNSRDDYSSNSAAASELTKALAAALSNPATVSSLLNNLGGGKNGPTGGSQSGPDYSRDYQSSNSDYKDYSYSKERNYNPYPGDDNYGASSSGGVKYGGGSGGSVRY